MSGTDGLAPILLGEGTHPLLGTSERCGRPTLAACENWSRVADGFGQSVFVPRLARACLAVAADGTRRSFLPLPMTRISLSSKPRVLGVEADQLRDADQGVDRNSIEGLRARRRVAAVNRHRRRSCRADAADINVQWIRRRRRSVAGTRTLCWARSAAHEDEDFDGQRREGK